MKIAIDAMGGDYAPVETVKGAIKALGEIEDIFIYLVGKKEIIERELEKYSYNSEKLAIIDAREVIEMTDDPVTAVRGKKDSSMNRALELVKNGEAQACVSAGNTGALISASQLKLRRIKGVLRPAITTIFPGKKRDIVLMDAGATADCKPEFINQFAIMGSLYYKELFGEKNPRVGLLNIGTEIGKGNEITREAYELLEKNNRINFVGNIEAREMTDGDVDILVTDGFTGNMVLKTSEGTAKFIFSELKKEIYTSLRTKIGAWLLKPAFEKLKQKTDASEYGGALFLGLNGISIKAHGNSTSKGFKNAIKVANKFAESDFITKLSEAIDKEDN